MEKNTHSGIIIDELHFARVLLYMNGHITEDVGDLTNAKIYIEDVSGFYGKFSPETLEIDPVNRTFKLHYHILSIRDKMPLLTGDYYLRIKCHKKVWPAYVSEEMHHIAENGRLITAEQDTDELRTMLKKNDNNMSFWNSRKSSGNGSEIYEVISKLDLDDDTYFLSITGQFFKGAGGGIRQAIVTSFKRTKKKLHNLLMPMKQQMQIDYFNRLQKKRQKKTGKKTLLFASQSRAVIGGNEEFIYNRMKERGLLDQFHVLMDFYPTINEGRGIIGARKLTKKLALSDIILIDDFFPFVYKFDFPDDVKFIQVWHACGAFKAVGFERIGKKGAPAVNTRAHKCYTHMPVDSPHSGHHNAEAFGLPESVFIPTGVPRTDMFFDEAYKNEVIKKLRAEYPIFEQRNRIHLYAPTFRGNGAQSAYFPYQRLDLKAWGKSLKEHNELLIIKMHPFVPAKAQIPEEYKDYILDFSDYREINDILFIADTMTTDYSSVMYEYSLLRRPMYFFAFDQKAYESTRDFYEPYEETVPGYIIKSFPELLKALEDKDYDYSLIDKFVEKNFTYTDGKSTDRCIDEIIMK